LHAGGGRPTEKFAGFCGQLTVAWRILDPVRGRCVGWFWMEQAHADQLLVVIDALDDVSVQLELADDGGWEGNPAGVQLGKSDGLAAGLAQSVQQPLLLGVSKRHRRIVALQRGLLEAASVSEPRYPRPRPRTSPKQTLEVWFT
jgi:hypothetical protein